MANRETILAAALRGHEMLRALHVFATEGAQADRIASTHNHLGEAIAFMSGSDESFVANIESVGVYLARVEEGRLGLTAHRQGSPEERTRAQLSRMITLFSHFEQELIAGSTQEAVGS